jgi:DNA-binding transcriptional regulator YiaG
LKHGWVRRALLYDRHEARAINEEMMAGKAGMRRRLAQQAMNLQHRAGTRIKDMTPSEIARLTPAQVVSFLRAAAEIETKARTVSDSELGQSERDDAPTFNINFIPSRPEGMTAVRMRTGEAGYIPSERVDEFLAEFPDAVAVR